MCYGWVTPKANKVNWYIRFECNGVTEIMPISDYTFEL